MKTPGETYERNLVIAAYIRLAMFLPDRFVNLPWQRIDRLPKMDARLVKDPSERN